LTGYALAAAVKKMCKYCGKSLWMSDEPPYHSTLTLLYLTCDISTSLTPIRVRADIAALAAVRGSESSLFSSVSCG